MLAICKTVRRCQPVGRNSNSVISKSLSCYPVIVIIGYSRQPGQFTTMTSENVYVRRGQRKIVYSCELTVKSSSKLIEELKVIGKTGTT